MIYLTENIEHNEVNKLDEHESRLNKHDKDIGDIKETVKTTDKKIDVIVQTTDKIATTVGNKAKENIIIKENKEGTIQEGDWRGTIAALIGFIITAGLTAWQLWSVMFGDTNPFIASLSVMMTPAIWVLIETITGRTIKNNEVMHRLEIKKQDDAHKIEIDKFKGVNQIQMAEVYSYKEKIARLEERSEVIKEKVLPPAPILP